MDELISTSKKKPIDLSKELEIARGLTPYIRVDQTLLLVLSALGVDANEACATFVDKFNEVRVCDFNYRYFGHKAPVWVLRDKFPSVDVYYKMTVSLCKPRAWDQNPFGAQSDDSYFLVMNVKLITPKYKNLSISYNDAQKYLLERAEFDMLDIDEKPKPFLNVEFKKPRKMKPKGFK